MRRYGRFGLVGCAAVAASVLGIGVAPPAAEAASSTEYGTVVFVADGDTLDVDVTGDGTSSPVRVRMAGIQAMEQRTYKINLALASGECHALPATERLRRILGGKRVTAGKVYTDGATVRLTARDSASSSRSREERYVSVRTASGSWRDVGTTLVAEGLVLPQPHPVEYTMNRSYRVLARRAAARHIGLWNRDSCGSRPAATAALAVAVNWDAAGDDAKNLNGEYFKVTNTGRSSVSLAGWWVRDSALRRFTFPGGTSLAPGASVYVHAGRGAARTDSAGRHFYWGQTSAVFENVTKAPSWMGDGGYLFDPRGNLRAWKQYGLV